MTVKQVVIAVAKYGLGFGLLAWVIAKNWAPEGGHGLQEVWENPQQLQPIPILIATLLLVAGVVLTFIRWFLLVRAQDLPLTFIESLRLGMIGYFGSSFLPGSIGGDAIKAVVIARQQSRRTVAVATVLIDRLIGLWGLFWLVAISGSIFWLAGDPAIAAKPYLQTMVKVAVGTVAGSIAAWFLLGLLPVSRAQGFALDLERIPKVGGSMAEFWRAFWLYRCRGRAVAFALVISLIAQVGFVLAYHFSAYAFLPPGEDSRVPSATEHFLIVPIGMTGQALFPAPGGVGGGEFIFGYLYELIKYREQRGVFMSLMYRAITWALAFLGYLIALRMKPQSVKAGENAPDTSESAETDTDPLPISGGQIRPELTQDTMG